MRKRKNLGVFLLFSGLCIFMFFNYFNSELNRIKDDKLRYINEKNGARMKIQSEFYEITEKIARNQMKLNLENARNSIENISKEYNIDMTNHEQSVKLINFLTDKMYFYDKEGDTFAITSNGDFLTDDSADCGQPFSFKKPRVPLLNIKDRKRTFEDEIAWQFELRYVLYSQGIIKDIPNFIIDSATEKIRPIKEYKVDFYLNHAEVFKTREISYIEENYPEIFKLLRKYKIIMHSDFSKVENVTDFFMKQLDSEHEKLYWEFNPYPYKEILEIVWIPQGERGFNNQKKSFSGAEPNPNFLKIGIVQGAQFRKIIDEYHSVIKGFDDDFKNDILTFDKNYAKEKRNIEIMAIIISVLFVIVCFALIQVILNNSKE